MENTINILLIESGEEIRITVMFETSLIRGIAIGVDQTTNIMVIVIVKILAP